MKRTTVAEVQTYMDVVYLALQGHNTVNMAGHNIRLPKKPSGQYPSMPGVQNSLLMTWVWYWRLKNQWLTTQIYFAESAYTRFIIHGS